MVRIVSTVCSGIVYQAVHTAVVGEGRFDLIDSMVQPIRGEMTLAPRYEVIVVLDCYVTLLEVTLRLWIP